MITDLGSLSFRTRLVLAAAATVVLVQIVGALVDIYSGYVRLSAEMDATGELLVNQTASTISWPLWDFDDTLVKEVLESLLQIKDFAGVAIVSVGGETDVELLSDATSTSETLRIYAKPIVIQDGNATETLGTLKITMSTSGLWTALWRVALHKTLLVVAILGMASVALYLVLGRLSKPLEDLRKAVYAIEREEFNLPVPGRDRTDEIGALANALDGLREREAELAMLRRANNEKSQREGKRVQQALQSTRDAVVIVDEVNTIVFTNGSAECHFPGFRIGAELIERRSTKRSRADEIRSALLSRKEVDMEITLEQKGIIRHFQARTGPIVDSSGNDLGGLFLASDFTEQFEHSREASYLASHDPLTGLLNRRQMDAALAKWVEDASQPIGVMLIDLDHFKTINDTFGHQHGDTVLIRVGQEFRDLSLSDDLVVRLGGDEFAIITRGPNSERHLNWIASSAIDALKTPVQLHERAIKVSISVGIATSETAGWNVQALMRHADLALYEAKEGGRGRAENYKDALSATHERRRTMEESFRTALDTDCIFPVFQAQTAIDDGSVVGFEILARWHDPDLGLINPAEFIPLAENADMIEPLTRRILTDACETALEWRSLGFQHRIAVNLSPKLFDGIIFNLVKECLSLTECPPEMIELEITESVLLSNSSAVKKEIDDLRAIGLNIALDDFGTGYSSLDYLRRFPVDKIKIDRAFVRHIASSEQSRAIVTAISQLGHSLGMKVTGEGAETQEDRIALKGCGVDVIQGFVDGQPALKSEAEQMFLTGPTQKKAVS
ncbi:MAG TPA: EAL domain-containing protein [Roseovarius sp.]